MWDEGRHERLRAEVPGLANPTGWMVPALAGEGDAVYGTCISDCIYGTISRRRARSSRWIRVVHRRNRHVCMAFARDIIRDPPWYYPRQASRNVSTKCVLNGVFSARLAALDRTRANDGILPPRQTGYRRVRKEARCNAAVFTLVIHQLCNSKASRACHACVYICMHRASQIECMFEGRCARFINVTSDDNACGWVDLRTELHNFVGSVVKNCTVTSNETRFASRSCPRVLYTFVIQRTYHGD